MKNIIESIGQHKDFIFKDYEDFLANAKNGQNGATKQFIKDFYDGEIEWFIESNINNTNCFNCFECEDCDDCYGCDNCTKCIKCVECTNCNKCNMCGGLVSQTSRKKSIKIQNIESDEAKDIIEAINSEDGDELTDEQLKAKYVFNSEDDYLKARKESGEPLNGISDMHLTLYYNDDIRKWYEWNTTNTNCWNCDYCVNCTDCIECRGCVDCTNCGRGQGSINCVDCGSDDFDDEFQYCVNCENCKGCKYCIDCTNCKAAITQGEYSNIPTYTSYCDNCDNLLACWYQIDKKNLEHKRRKNIKNMNLVHDKILDILKKVMKPYGIIK